MQWYEVFLLYLFLPDNSLGATGGVVCLIKHWMRWQPPWVDVDIDADNDAASDDYKG